jgi:hypothetical protein
MDPIMKKRYDDLNIYQVASVLAVALFVPSYVVSKPQELKCPNGDPFYPDAGSVDANVSTFCLLQSLQSVGELPMALFLLCNFPNFIRDLSTCSETIVFCCIAA